MKKLGVILSFLLISLAVYAAIPWEIPNNDMKMGDGSNVTSKSLEMRMGLGASNPIFSSLNGTEMNVNIPFRVQGNFNVEGAGNFDGSVTMGDGTAVDRTLLVNRGGANPFLRWDESENSWVFSNDGALEKKIGSGDGGGTGGISSLDNPGFEDGISKEWTCTASRCTEEIASPLVLTKSLKFDPSALNDNFESTLKAIPVGIMGAACESRVFYTGGDENLSAQIIDGNGLILSEIILKAHSIASFESIFYLCPTKTEILGDIQKGNLKLKVTNKTATAAATSTFDEMYKGSLIGLVETSSPDSNSARIQNNGVASIISQTSDSIVSVNRVSGGIVDLVFKSGLTVIPSVDLTSSNEDANNISITYSLLTTIGVRVHTSRLDAVRDLDFNIEIHKQGVDAKQSIQIYKNIPKVTGNINNFSAKIENNGTASIGSESSLFIQSVTRTGAGVVDVVYITGLVTITPGTSGTVTSGFGDYSVEISASTPSGFTYRTFNVAGVPTDQDITLRVSKQGVDFKLPTVQPILIHQVETSFEPGVRIEACRFNNNGTLTIDTNSGICDWISSFTRLGVGNISFSTNAGVFSGYPVCTMAIGTGFSGSGAQVTPSSNADIDVTTRNESGVLTDMHFNITCIGAR